METANTYHELVDSVMRWRKVIQEVEVIAPEIANNKHVQALGRQLKLFSDCTVEDIIKQDVKLAGYVNSSASAYFYQALVDACGKNTDELIEGLRARLLSPENGGYGNHGCRIWHMEWFNKPHMWMIREGRREAVEPTKWERVALMVRGYRFDVDTKVSTVIYGG